MIGPAKMGTAPPGGSAPDTPAAQPSDHADMGLAFSKALVRRQALGEGPLRSGGGAPDEAIDYPERSKQCGALEATLPMPLPAQTALPTHAAKRDEERGPSHAGTAIALRSSGLETTNAAKPGAGTTSTNATDFAKLFTRMDAGTKPSAKAEISLHGDGWRASHVLVSNADGKLAIAVQLNGRAANTDLLEELRRRMRSKDIQAGVTLLADERSS